MAIRSNPIPTYKIREFFKVAIVTFPYTEISLPDEFTGTKGFDISLPHMSDYFVFILLQEGKFSNWIDFDEIVMEGPSLFYFLPTQLRYTTLFTGLKGWLLLIDATIIDRQLSNVLEREIFNPVPITVSFDVIEKLSSLIDILHKIRLSIPDSFDIQRHLANGYLALFANEYLNNSISKRNIDNRQFQITQQFYELLRRDWQIQKSPIYYAKEMNISLNYLNGCIKTTTGNPVSYWIHLEIIQQAKRSLYHSDLTIKEIAHHLGFDDTAYFTRIFTKLHGKSPKQFREEFSKNRLAS